jgi:hypothetical protein
MNKSLKKRLMKLNNQIPEVTPISQIQEITILMEIPAFFTLEPNHLTINIVISQIQGILMILLDVNSCIQIPHKLWSAVPIRRRNK